MANEQISLPSVILIVVLSVVVLRYLFLSPARPSAQQQQQAQARDSAAAQRRRDAAVEQLQQMFPQVDRRTLLWDLQRTGGNMSATTERILSGRVETPPVTFQPPPPPSPSPSLTSQSHVQKAPPSVTEPDLITRYNLQNKVSGASEDAADDKKAQGWSSNKDERQSLLQKRRNEMILQARRRMEAKIAAERAAGGS